MNMEKGMTQEEKEQWKKVMKIENDEPLIQVRRTTGTNMLHLQVFGEVGEYGNRPYGYADKFSVPPVVTASVATVEAPYPSFASAQEIYIRDIATVHGYADGVQLHITAPSTEWNAPHGFVLDLPAQRFSAFIAFVEAVGLLTNHEGEQRFVAQPQEEE
jgi:hypothetical protein